MKKYYEAYDERYKEVHSKGISWFGENATQIVGDTIKKFGFDYSSKMLEIGCGEGRDAKAVLENGYNLLATDISAEAIRYCKRKISAYENSFVILDCLNDKHSFQYDFIYSVAVVHMLVLNEDRNTFYQFIKNHLVSNGISLICSMGNGNEEMQTDISQAFNKMERHHKSGTMLLTSTSCRKVSFEIFEKEIQGNGLQIIEQGITHDYPNFNELMYAIVKTKE